MIKLITCNPMNARVTEAQCRRNQEKAKTFYENQSEYFRAARYSKKRYTHAFRRYQWGVAEIGEIFQPVDTACLHCNLKKVIYRSWSGVVYGNHKKGGDAML